VDPRDPIDSFYQQLESEDLLNLHGKELVAEARAVLAKQPMARVCGVAATPDSQDAAQLRRAIQQMTGQQVPPGKLVGIMPRGAIEGMLQANVDPAHWSEEAWQPQRVLPVLASTRDGMRFGFCPLGELAAEA